MPSKAYPDEISSDTQYVKDWLGSLSQMVKEDDQARQEWMQSMTNAYRLRYMLEWRRVEFPWPGASDIVMPLIDMMCDRLKPSYLNLITMVHPPVTVLAVDRASMEKTAAVELWFDWLIRKGSPNFVRECALCIDDVLETGRGILKTLWWYETRTAPETLSIRTLDRSLLPFVVPTKKQRKLIDKLMVRPEIASPIDFDGRLPEIEAAVEKAFDLDEKDPIDKKARQQILAWLRGGAEDPTIIKTRDRVIDQPAIVAVPPTALIVPSEATGVEEAEHLTHLMYLNERQIRSRVQDAGWDADVVEALLGSNTRSATAFPAQRNLDYLEQEQAIREGVGYRAPRQWTIYESCCWMDLDRDGYDEKVICTFTDQFPDRPLKLIAYERPSGHWPYHTAEFELNKRRWYSPRGIPHKLADLQKEWTVQHRSKLNRMLIANAPTFIGRMNSMLNWQTQRWIPGQILWSLDPSRDVLPLPVPNLDMSFKDEENYLRQVAEAFIGSPDYGNVNPMSSLTEPRTATEIRGIQQQTNQALSLRGTIFQTMMSEVYSELFDLWQTWGTDDVWVKVTDDEPIRLSKEDLQGKYVFQCTGRIGEQDPFQESARALARLQVLMMVQQAGALGPEYEIDWPAAILDYLEKDDMRIAHRIIRKKSPEEIQQEQEAAEGMAALQGRMAALQFQGGNGQSKPKQQGPKLLGQAG